jgi:hypothetical protein
MKKRKLRYRRDELEAMSIHKLRELMRSLAESSTDCFDKRDLVDRLVNSNKITIVEGVPAMELTEEEFHQMGVKDLKRLLHDFGLSAEGALEKSELREVLLQAGRVLLTSSPSVCSIETLMEEETSQPEPMQPVQPMITTDAPTTSVPAERFQIHEDVLRSMSIAELMEFMRCFDILTTGCLERADMLDRIHQSDGIECTND